MFPMLPPSDSAENPPRWVLTAPPKSEPNNRGIVIWRPLPPSQTEDLEAPYFYALGRLVHELGKVELFIQVALRTYAGLTAKKARDLLDEMSLFGCVRAFKRLASDRPKIEQKTIESLFDQYKAIKTLRDHCAHRTADRQEDGTYLASNEAISKNNEGNEYLWFEIDDLRKATIDLNGMIAVLSDITYPNSPNRYDVPVPPWKYMQRPIEKPLAKKR